MKEMKQNSKDNVNLENNNESRKENNLFTEMFEKIDKKNVLIGCLIVVIIISAIFMILNNESEISENNSGYEKKIPITRHNVKIHIDFTENLFLSRYNVILSIGNERETLVHGENKDLEFSLEEGNYTLTFTNSEDSSIKNETTINVNNDMEIGYKVSCHSDNISVTNLYVDVDEEIADDEVEIKTDKSEFVYKNYKDVIKKINELGFTNIVEKPMYDIVFGWTEEGEVDNVTINGSDTYKRGDIFKKDTEIVVSYHLKEEDDPSKKVDNLESGNTNQISEEQTNQTNEIKYNYYTTNDNETAKKGDSGKFSFVKKNDSYKVYWIIDFDNGYVYYFSDGNGDETCEKIKIKAGNLNDGLELSYKNSSNAWAKYIHFKYKNQPHQLVIVDNDYFNYEFSTTSLRDALELMESKTIWEP